MVDFDIPVFIGGENYVETEDAVFRREELSPTNGEGIICWKYKEFEDDYGLRGQEKYYKAVTLVLLHFEYYDKWYPTALLGFTSETEGDILLISTYSWLGFFLEGKFGEEFNRFAEGNTSDAIWNWLRKNVKKFKIKKDYRDDVGDFRGLTFTADDIIKVIYGQLPETAEKWRKG